MEKLPKKKIQLIPRGTKRPWNVKKRKVKMEIQDKINELIEKFSRHVNPYIGSGFLSNTYDDDAILWQAQHCALITANEILSNTPMYTGNLNPKWKFWNDIKLELERLTKN